MTTAKTYNTARAFRTALETRLKKIATDEGVDLQRLRRLLTFDRLLARLFVKDAVPWVLKGGYSLELRLHHARTTKDIDLVIEDAGIFSEKDDSTNNKVREKLQEQVSMDMGDHLVFLIGEPMMDIDAAPYGGARYQVDARMDGRTFVKFHLDVGIGDVVLAPLEVVKTRDWLGFAGLQPPVVSMLSKEQQFAEKLHAYTLPHRETPNSRVKDLVDMVMLIQHGSMDQDRVKHSISATFEKRNTHNPPNTLSPPPDSWKTVFERMTSECDMDTDIEAAFRLLSEFMM